MFKTRILPLLLLVFILASCDAPATGRMMRRISPVNGKCYFYVPLDWTDETTAPDREYKASAADPNGTVTVSFTWEALPVQEDNEQFWEHYLSEEWWEEWWAAERRPTWESPVIEETSRCNRGGYRCIYTEGATRTTLIVVVDYDNVCRLRFTEPAASDRSADLAEITDAFLWK